MNLMDAQSLHRSDELGDAVRRRFTLPKSERLAARSDIGRLFTCGEAFLVYPVKCTCRFRPGARDNRMMVIVPKRNYKRAVDRNLLKRRMREAYRLHRSEIGVDVAFSYVGKGDPAAYRTIEKAMISIWERLIRMRDERQAAATEHSGDRSGGGGR